MVRVFSLLIFCHLGLIFLTEQFLLSDNLYYEAYGDVLPIDAIDRLISNGSNWSWLAYICLPIFVMLRVLSVCFLLHIGSLFIKTNTSFTSLLRVPLQAEFIFLLPGFTKLIWFLFFHTEFTLHDLQYFAPLSVLSMVNPLETPSYMIYPLQLLNLFEVGYWCILASRLGDILKFDFASSIAFLACTYGVGLLLWVIFIMFLTVSLG